MDNGNHNWTPHKPEDWPFRYMTTKAPVTLNKWNGHHPVEQNTETIILPVGTRVKIVMASRLGDIGITDDLNSHHGYHARFMTDNLETLFCDFGTQP